MKTNAFTFNSRTIRTTKPSAALDNLTKLVTDLSQVDFFDKDGKEVKDGNYTHPDVVSAKRKAQVREVSVCDFNDLLQDEVKGTYIISQLIAEAQFAMARAAFDSSLNGILPENYAITVDALHDYVTPVSSSTGSSVKVKKSDIKLAAMAFGEYVSSKGVSAKGTSFMFGLAGDGFTNVTGIENAMLVKVQERFLAFIAETENETVLPEALELMAKNLQLAVVNSQTVTANDL